MEKKILKISIVALIISLLLIIVILSNKEETEPNIIPETSEIVETETISETQTESFKESSSTELEIVEFTEKQKNKVDEAFNSFMDNAEYQTTLNENDSILYVTFKGLGTVTFKLYDDYAPNSINWLQELIETNTNIRYDDKRDGGRLGYGNPQFKFITTDREYDRSEQVSEIFPMKYCLYHILQSCNNFYFCTMDYMPNIIDSHNVPEEYLKYLETYGGNMSVYGSSVVLGRAVENAYILDNLSGNFQIESMTMIRNGVTYTSNYETEDFITSEISTNDNTSSTEEFLEEPNSEMINEDEFNSEIFLE